MLLHSNVSSYASRPYLSAGRWTSHPSPLRMTGPLAPLMLGITYATSKDDDDDGLSYARFLDAVLDLAFECKRNVAAELEAGSAKRRQVGAITWRASCHTC